MALRPRLFLVVQEVGLSEWRRLFRKVVFVPSRRRVERMDVLLCVSMILFMRYRTFDTG